MIITFIYYILSTVSIQCLGANIDYYFTEHPQANAQVIENTEFVFKCDVSDRSAIVFHWLLDDNIVLNTSRRYQVGSYLHIKHISRDYDNGEFKCIATNFITKHSYESSAGNLAIQWLTNNVTVVRGGGGENVTATSDDDDDDDVVNKYSSIVLRCLATASKSIGIEWYHNGNRIYLGEDKYETDDNTLSIHDLNEDDIGVYSCKATIELGEFNVFSIYSSDNYLLKLSLINYKLYPQLTYLTSNKVIRANAGQQELRLTCNFINYDKIEWQFAHRETAEYHTDTNGSLVLNKVRANNSGFYTCVASNRGHRVAYSIRVEVLSVGDLKLYPPTSGDDGVYIVQVDRKFSLICTHPDIEPKYVRLSSIEWLSSYDTSGTLDIDEVAFEHAAANYTCVATVKNITKTLVASLYVLEKPFLIEMPEDRVVYERNENVDFVCRFSLDMRNYSKSVILASIKVNTSWYFLASSQMTSDNYDDEDESVAWKLVDESQQLTYTEHSNEFTSTLGLHSVTQSNFGYYKCEIKIEHFDVVTSNRAKLYSIVNKSFDEDSGESNRNENNLHLLLNCDVDSDNDVVEDVKWVLPDGKTIDDEKWSPLKILENGSLLILNGTKRDTGTYTCVIKTSISDEYLTHAVVFNETKLVIAQSVRNTKLKRRPLNIKHTIIIVIVCSFIYLIIAALIIFYCKAKLFKTNSTCKKRRRERHMTDDDGRNNIKYTKTLDSSNEVTETSEMLAGGTTRPSVQHQYENIDEGISSHMEIKRFLEANGSSKRSIKKPPPVIQAAISQSSIGTHLTLSSVARVDTESYLNSLHSFTMYGKCCYGDVYLASSSMASTKRVSVGKRTVALKILRNLNHEQSIIEFHRDIETYSKISSENIVRLIDVCTEKGGEAPNIVILEHSDYGDLKEYLEQRSEAGNSPSAFEKLHICYQIALAMKHFEHKLLIHGDLATRNCVVYAGSRGVHVKVSNLALCGDKYQQEYVYRSEIMDDSNNSTHDAGFPIPLRWMSPEWLLDATQSIKSDVWSYSVCCWEVWKDGQLPYVDLSDVEVYQTLKNYDLCRLDSLADLCPVEMWTLMEKCWLESTEMRPSFHACVSILYSLLDDISLKKV